MFSGVESVQNSDVNDQLEGEKASLTEMVTRITDVESRLPILNKSSSNEVPMSLLPTSANLADVISAVNELIKRDLTTDRVK